MSTIVGHTTRANGTILTATIYNADHTNHISNAQALNADKLEGATPPVVDGHAVLFDGTSGAAIRTGSAPPYLVGSSLIPISEGGTGEVTAAAAFGALKQDATEDASGVVEKATDAEIRSAATGTKGVMAEDLESAAAAVGLTDAATIAIDWDTFINGTVTLGGNRTLGNPTNGQPGTYRRIQVTQDGTGSRTLAYDTQYVFQGGAEPVLTTAAGSVDVLIIYCRTTTIFEVSATLDWKA